MATSDGVKQLPLGKQGFITSEQGIGMMSVGITMGKSDLYGKRNDTSVDGVTALIQRCLQAGVGQVIKGWDQGLLGMKLGEERQVVIPGHEGYGPAGFPAWGIPPGGTLDFTLEVLNID